MSNGRVKCAKEGCQEFAVYGWKYCSKQCSPYGTLGDSQKERAKSEKRLKKMETRSGRPNEVEQ